MSRDHRKLHVFHDSHRLVLAIYRATKDFPRDEWFGIRLQMRKAAVSVPANLVEGNAAKTTRDYCSFLNVALASACELAYLVTLAIGSDCPLGSGQRHEEQSSRVVRQMQTLSDDMEARPSVEEQRTPAAQQGPEPEDRRPETGDRTGL